MANIFDTPEHEAHRARRRAHVKKLKARVAALAVIRMRRKAAGLSYEMSQQERELSETLRRARLAAYKPFRRR